jgi:hypothetical protein
VYGRKKPKQGSDSKAQKCHTFHRRDSSG